MGSPSVTLKELDELVRMLFDLKDEIQSDEEKISEKQKRLDTLKAKAVEVLKEHARENYQAPRGTITIAEKWRVNLPQTDPDKEALLEHLKERGIYMKYVTVNANALNSLFLADWKAAQKEGQGMDFKMPGIGEPKLFEALSMRAKT